MNKEQLQNLLNQKYDAANWNKIYGSIFPNVMLFSSPKEIAVTENWVKSFKQRGLVRLQGNQDVAIFEVVLKDGISVQSKRVGLRNLVAKLIDEYQNHGVLAVFDNGSPEYRFTFAAKETKVTREGIEKTETDSKRYTYILGETETCKTAAEQFIKLSEKGSTISLSDLQEAFSVEKLSKQFFNEYKEQYNYFVSYLASQPKILKSAFADDEKRMRDFVKLLLGRLVFLQFVQKKRWLGVPSKNTDWSSGDVKFLLSTYKVFPKKEKYYSEFLEELFFECLNSPNRKNELFSITGTKVPFLNGGLFENDNPKTKSINFPVSYFDSLFDFFGRYNFTIDENDPTEKEVGIDPEMLGSIFENLLEDNKDKGAFYTPKEIVHYMCQESLIEYLCTKVNAENDEKVATAIRNLITKRKIDERLTGLIEPIAIALREVKICDPAIGSGAFPMGMLMEIFHCVFELYNADPKVVSREWNMNGWQANVVKSNIIQNSIYGVDIEKGAVDIARLRFWLSLIVDEDEPKALPNLDYKIVVGNSLVSKLGDDIIDIDWEVKVNTEAAEKLLQEIHNNLNKLFKTQKVFFDFNGKKENLKEEIRSLKIDVLISQLQLDKFKYANSSAQIGSLFEMTAKEKTIEQERKQKLEGFDKTIRELQKLKIKTDQALNFFDWKLDYPEVMNDQINSNAGFDIVIANPPYGAKLDEDLKIILKKRYDYLHTRTMDSYNFFVGVGSDLLKKSGILTYIIPNAYLFQVEFEKSRGHFMNNFSPRIFLNLGENIFDAVVPSCIFSFVKSTVNSKVFIGESKDRNNGFIDFSKGIHLSKSELLEFGSSTIPFNFKDQSIIKKIQKKFTTSFNDICLEVNSGITTGHKTAYLIPKTKATILKIENDVLFPTLEGRNISPFKINYDNKVILYTDKEFNPSKNPNTIKYLEEYYEELANRSEVVQGIKEWYSLGRARGQNLLAAPKIMCRETGDSIISCFDDYGYYPMNTVICIKLNTNSTYLYKSICSILNSKLINFIFKSISQEEGRTFAKVRPINLRKLPIPNWNENQINYLSNIFDAIVKEDNLDSKKINELNNYVYKLYDLTYDEVKVIDPEFELSSEEYEKIELE